LSRQNPTNKKKIDARNGVIPVLPIINFVDCLENFAEAEHIDFLTEMGADKTTRLKSFPPYLIFSMKLFDIDYTTWREKKLDVSIQVPDEIDLSFLRGHGIQPGEVPLEASAVVEKPLFNEEVVSMIEMMGFGRNQAIRASFNNPGNNAEVAMDWLMMHMDDSDINDPLPKSNNESDKPQFNEEVVGMIEMMGFGRNQAIRASFNNPGNNAEVAMDWFSFPHLSSG
jgi:ubiquitin carboxyl-terminal hydrolase 5/13